MSHILEKKPLQSTSVQIRLTEKEKSLVNLLVERSPQSSISEWILHLIDEEWQRCMEFDSKVADYIHENRDIEQEGEDHQ